MACFRLPVYALVLGLVAVTVSGSLGVASCFAEESPALTTVTQPVEAVVNSAVKQQESEAPAVTSVPDPVAGDYQIGPGDLLEIAVWKDEALTRSSVVLPDGKIHFPLIGEVLAGGKTIAVLKQELVQRLSRYVPDLVLSVEVKQSNSMLVYVIGRVNQPGRLMLNTRINVLQALAMAGGFNPYASKDRVKIFRQEKGETRILPFHYSEIILGERLSENMELQRGDVVVVP